jgi:branched-chain amino acid transport system permease protein
MDAQLVVSGVIFGLSLGSILFLVSIGLSLCFGLMRVISLDQLLYYSLGAYVTYSTSVATGSVWAGIVAAMAAAGVASLAVERAIFRRIYERSATFSMITTFGILIGGIGLLKLGWGLVPRPVPMPMAMQVDVFGTDVPAYRLFVIAVAAAVYGGIHLFLHRTIVGKAIRAGIENVEHVEALGINVARLFTITFLVAGTLSGLAGALHAPLVMVDPTMGLELLAIAFMVVIIGGLGSVKGTLVSALLVGQVMSLGSLVYAPLAQMAPFAVMMLILLVRPTGLYGSPLLRR